MRTIGAIASAGCVFLSSSSRTQPLTMISGPVEQSSATSIVSAFSASAIGVLQASSSVTSSVEMSIPYGSFSAPAQTGFVGQSVARPHLRSFATAVRSLHLVRLDWSAVSLRTTSAFVSWPGV